MPATTIAAQVRGGRRWPTTTRATSAVRSGAIAIVTSTLATVVIVIATMKAVNITAQQTPDSQSVGSALRSVRPSEAGPRRRASRTTSASALKTLRQNVASKPLTAPSWRVTTPAMLQSSVATTIAATARPCVFSVEPVGAPGLNSRCLPIRARGCRTWSAASGRSA